VQIESAREPNEGQEATAVQKEHPIPGARFAPLAASILAAVALCSQAASAAEKIAVVPVENNAKVTADEIAILTNAVVASLAGGGAKFEIVLIAMKPGEACNRLCVFNRAKVTGARYLVTGAVVLFGGKYTLKFEAQDRITDSIVSSANTPVVDTLLELLPLARDAAESLRNDLAPPPPPPPAAPPIVAVPQAREAESDSPPSAMTTGVLSVTSNPPGAEVRLRTPSGGGFGALGRPGLAFSAKRGSSLLGVTPIKKNLYQGMYELRLELEGYEPERGRVVTVYVGETTEVQVDLEKSNPLLTGGVALTFGGTIVAVIGAILAGMRNDTGGSLSASQSAGVVVLISGGAMVISGTAMWIVHYHRKKEMKDRGALSVLPTRDGLAAGYARTF
jgi:hypothetical protein